MIFGKHINKYYLRYSWALLIGIAMLFFIDYMELLIPSLYRMVINGLNDGFNVIDGVSVPFDMKFVMDIAVQAIEAKKEGDSYVGYVESWANEANVTVEPVQ